MLDALADLPYSSHAAWSASPIGGPAGFAASRAWWGAAVGAARAEGSPVSLLLVHVAALAALAVRAVHTFYATPLVAAAAYTLVVSARTWDFLAVANGVRDGVDPARRAPPLRLPRKRASWADILHTAAQKGRFDAVCAVCLSDIGEGEILYLLNCGHAYHARCIDAWEVAQQGHAPPRGPPPPLASPPPRDSLRCLRRAAAPPPSAPPAPPADAQWLRLADAATIAAVCCPYCRVPRAGVVVAAPRRASG